MSEKDDQLEPTEEENAPQADDQTSAEGVTTSAPETPSTIKNKNVGGALLDDLLAVTDQEVAAEVEEVKATIRDREQADSAAKQAETARRRQELSDLRQQEIDWRKSKIRERQRRQALEAMAADNEPVDAELEVQTKSRGKGALFAVLFVMLAAGGVAAWWFLRPPEPANSTEQRSQLDKDSESDPSAEADGNEAVKAKSPLRVAIVESRPSKRRALETTFDPASIEVEKPTTVRKKRRGKRKKKSVTTKRKTKQKTPKTSFRKKLEGSK